MRIWKQLPRKTSCALSGIRSSIGLSVTSSVASSASRRATAAEHRTLDEIDALLHRF